MKDFGKLESELRAARPEPRDELVRALADRARVPRRRAQWSPRLAFAAVLTAGFVAALAPAGGLGYASGAISHAARAVKHTVVAVQAPTSADARRSSQSSSPSSASSSSHGDFHPTSGHHQYGVPICHADGHGHFDSIRVSDDVLPWHLHHAHDIVPAPPGGCPSSDDDHGNGHGGDGHHGSSHSRG